MISNPVGWFEIYVQDMNRAKKFYETIFETKLEKLDTDIEMWNFPMSMEHSGASGALVCLPDVPSGGNSILIYFKCDDCGIEASRIPSAGGQIHREKTSIGNYGFIVLAIDTEGNVFGLHSMK